MSKSDYTVNLVDDHILVIVDLNLGRMSVTNNVENVFKEINLTIPFKNLKGVIVQDTEGLYDVLRFTSTAKFLGWDSVGMATLTDALSVI